MTRWADLTSDQRDALAEEIVAAECADQGIELGAPDPVRDAAVAHLLADIPVEFDKQGAA